jgi:hypothetical protein
VANLRIVHNNIADTATVTASPTAGSYLAANLQTDYKSQFHRSTGTTVTYTLSWASPLPAQTVQCVSLPCTNLTATATIRIQLYANSDVTGEIVAADTGTVPAASSTQISQFTNPTGNLFAYGAVTKTVHWYNSSYPSVRAVKITVTDTSNPAGYIDCARIVCGTFWEPTYNASREGLVVSVTDTSANSRNDAGDLVSEQGFVYDQVQLNLELLTDTDRDTLLGIIRRRGVAQNVLLSVFPDNRTSTELAYLIYGKRSNSNINYVLPGFNSHSIEITGW